MYNRFHILRFLEVLLFSRRLLISLSFPCFSVTLFSYHICVLFLERKVFEVLVVATYTSLSLLLDSKYVLEIPRLNITYFTFFSRHIFKFIFVIIIFDIQMSSISLTLSFLSVFFCCWFSIPFVLKLKSALQSIMGIMEV